MGSDRNKDRARDYYSMENRFISVYVIYIISIYTKFVCSRRENNTLESVYKDSESSFIGLLAVCPCIKHLTSLILSPEDYNMYIRVLVKFKCSERWLRNSYKI